MIIGFPADGGELKDGVVNYFIGRGIARVFQTTTFGELDGKATPRLTDLVKAFNKSHIPSVTNSNMEAWQKTHVALVTSIANALYIHTSNNYALSKSTEDIKLMIQGIKEGFQVIEGLGYKVTPYKLQYFKLPVWSLAFIFKVIMSTKIAEVTMSKHTIVAHNEMSVLQEEFDELIKKSNRATPCMIN